jgi:hypothetical protein
MFMPGGQSLPSELLHLFLSPEQKIGVSLGGDSMDIGRLTERIKEVPDPRRAWGNIRHKPEDIFVIGVCGALAQMIKKMHDFVHFLPVRPAWGVTRR